MATQIEVQAQKLDPRAILPRYATEGAAGADLFSLPGQGRVVAPGQTSFFHTGVALAIPEGVVGLVCARSGLAARKGLAPANKVGVIDSDYRGELIVALHNHGTAPVTVAGGERVAQILFLPVAAARIIEATSLPETARGAGGFGSTGEK